MRSAGLLADLGLSNGLQHGGGYKWHHQQKGKKYTGEDVKGIPQVMASKSAETGRQAKAKRDQWLAEVRAFYVKGVVNWQEAMQKASAARKERAAATGQVYKTIKERNPLKGRTAASVNCKNPSKCPGKYDRPAQPYPKRSHRPLSLDQATKVLREYYKSQLDGGKFTGGNMEPIKRATKAMRQEISKTTTRKLEPGSSDSWLYRSKPNRYDMKGLDNGIGKASPAYKKLRKTRSDKGKKRF